MGVGSEFRERESSLSLLFDYDTPLARSSIVSFIFSDGPTYASSAFAPTVRVGVLGDAGSRKILAPGILATLGWFAADGELREASFALTIEEATRMRNELREAIELTKELRKEDLEFLDVIGESDGN